MKPMSVTPEELLAAITGRASEETVARIVAELDKPDSEIHEFARSFQELAQRATDPEQMDWRGYITERNLGSRRTR